MNSRRTFIKTTSAAFAAGVVLPSSFASSLSQSVSANDKINVALIGCRSHGWRDLSTFLARPEIRCVALADVNKTHLTSRIAELDKLGHKADAYSDYRKVLDRKDVDIVLIGTPDHWHCIQFVDACAAGKDVYVQKPIGNTIAECDVMVAAAQKYNRVVQVGQQTHSAKHVRAMIKYLRSGKLGAIGRVHIWANFSYGAIPQIVPDSDVPEGLDFDTWLGPAPKRTFNSRRHDGTWRMFWDYGGGLQTDYGVHLFDLALWGMDMKTLPKKIMGHGEKFYYPNGMHETFDTQTVTYQFDDFVMVWEHNAGLQSGPYGRNYGVSFHGTNGTLVVNIENWEVYPEKRKEGQLPEYSMSTDWLQFDDHVANFLECVKSRNRQTACPIETGSLCAKYAHTGNIVARIGGAALRYDDTRQVFDNSDANKYIKPNYRTPWKFPII